MQDAPPLPTSDGHSLSEQLLLDPSFFKDPHFESAARTFQVCGRRSVITHTVCHCIFQDHLYSGWFTHSHREVVDKHLAGVRDGTLHTPWKDDAWDQDHPEVNEDALGTDDAVQNPSGTIGIRREGSRGKER